MHVTVLLSAAIVEELELIGVFCGCRVDLFMFSCCCNFNPVYRYSLSVNLTLSITV